MTKSEIRTEAALRFPIGARGNPAADEGGLHLRAVCDPVAGSRAWSSLFAALPLATLFVLLGVVRVAAQWAALAALAVAIVIALAAYDMPADQAFPSASNGAAVAAYVRTLRRLVWAIVTVAAVLALAFVMNDSGRRSRSASGRPAPGAAFALRSPIIGWLGLAVTGSNALFGGLQVSAARDVESTRC